jgi:hypothetical protein
MVDHSEKIREILNFSGFPFQHHCAEVIGNLEGFQLAVEVPFTDPPTNGPLLGVHGSMDILAVAPDKQGDRLVCFVVECKRAKDDTKNWILLKNYQQRPSWPTFFQSERSQSPDTRGPLAASRSVTFPELGYKRGRDYDYTVNGIEVNAAQSQQNRNADEKIYKPLRQVAHATHAFETTFPKIIEGIDYLRATEDQISCVFIPVIVTTANIYVPEYPPGKVEKGDVASGDFALGEPRKWATYEFPLPDHMSYNVSRGVGSSITIGKRTIFIVNDEFMAEFFSKALSVIVSQQPPAH